MGFRAFRRGRGPGGGGGGRGNSFPGDIILRGSRGEGGGGKNKNEMASHSIDFYSRGHGLPFQQSDFGGGNREAGRGEGV